jgi:hypothetical protein
MNYSFITMQGIKSIADFHLMNIVWSSLSRATTSFYGMVKSSLLSFKKRIVSYYKIASDYNVILLTFCIDVNLTEEDSYLVCLSSLLLTLLLSLSLLLLFFSLSSRYCFNATALLYLSSLAP